ncbi:CDP-glycerol glycerophosphotransferase family protein [Robbsia sp. Bb-Pol-6]|uniref:CDP-glycerol glycerophosphotransferase family protein n=1 Tax=Robbsia betulipollinis TaxID=2981849 RepID=A0ABT3ZK13_9BURK|nr:CDP-glycerol glycerophosphotransferase family protein [Robbsia betulipollinis]
MISAVYGAEDYLNDFFRSLTRQTLDFKSSIELIMVDDGSIDASASVIKKWQARYPGNILYLHKQNGGQASARNMGMKYATGEWLTFIDPDDFVAANYFEEVENTLSSVTEPVSIVACKLVFYHEKNRRYSDSHPLRSLFTKHTQMVDLRKSCRHIQLFTNSAFFEKSIVTDNDITFDVRIRPTFEDAHFISRYLSHTLSRPAAYIGSTRYLYRKRQQNNSSVDTSWEKSGQYHDVLEYGVLDMLYQYRDRYDEIPLIIQRTALYQVIWYFKKMLNKPAAAGFLGNEGKEKFLHLLNQIFEHIDTETILSFDLAGIWFYHRVGLISLYKKTSIPFQIIYISDCDREQGLFQILYYSKASSHESFHIGGSQIRPIFEKTRRHTFFDTDFVVERIIWLPLTEDGMLDVKIAGYATRFSIGAQHRKKISILEIRRHFEERARARLPAGTGARMLKFIARLPPVRRRFSDAWALMDRNTQADDNGEHLYRHIDRHHPSINAFYIIDRQSHDWKRLKKDNFRLVAFNSLAHKLLLLNCSHLVTSHIDVHIIHALSPATYGDRMKFKLTFLQHGVIVNDMSPWLNTKKFSLFITSSKQEYHAISGHGTYKFSPREVRLTGLPRHDALFDSGAPEKCIVIMPTWRQSLMGPIIPGTGKRALNPRFSESQYFQEWSALLRDPTFARLTQEKGYRIVFFPHANIQPYLDLFSIPYYITVLTHRQNSIQDLFRSGAVMITDYSSVACEFGFMQKPVIYFHYERRRRATGEHLYEFSDYTLTGFGPVAETVEEVTAALDDIVGRDCRMADEYQRRSDAYFGYRDTRNCERVVDAIRALGQPVTGVRPTPAQLRDEIGRAYEAAAWGAVAQGCAMLRSHPDRSTDDDRHAALFGACAALDDTAAGVPSRRFVAQPASRRWERLLDNAAWDRDSVLLARRQFFLARLDAGDYPGALMAVRQLPRAQARVGDPTSFRIQARLAGLAAEHDDVRVTRRIVTRLLAASWRNTAYTCCDGDRNWLRALAAYFTHRGDDLKARCALMQSLRMHPDDAPGARRLNGLLDRYEETHRSRRQRSAVFCDALGTRAALSSKPLDIAICLAAECRLAEEYDTATEILQRALGERPFDPFLHLEAGETALSRERWQDAAKHFRTARHALRARNLPRLDRGLLLASKHHDACRGLTRIARKALAAYPDDYAVAAAFARVALREQRWRDAEQSACRAMELSARHAASHRIEAGKIRLATLQSQGRASDALQHVDHLISLDLVDREILEEHAALAFGLGKWHAAACTFERLAQTAESDAHRSQLMLKRAQSLWWEGQRKDAGGILRDELEARGYAAFAANDLAAAMAAWSPDGIANYIGRFSEHLHRPLPRLASPIPTCDEGAS